MYVVKMKFIILLLLLFSHVYSSSANLKSMTCEGNIKEFKNYVRLLYDTDTDESFDQTTKCSFLSIKDDLNKKKIYNLQFGIRMSDMIKHDETDDDYLKIDVGPADIIVRPFSIDVNSDSNKNNCKVDIFQDENSPMFSHEKIFYLRVVFQQGFMNILYAPSHQKRWSQCSKLPVSSVSERKLNFEAYSEFGINLDIVHVDVDAKTDPWRNKENVNNIQSTEHRVEHTQQAAQLFQNITNKEFTRLGSSVQWLWYYQWFITIVLIFIVIKYKMDNKRKMHLL